MRLSRLRLLRSPGIRVPFTLEAEPGINLVTGPNGVGKSSLCRAVRSLLWPETVGITPFDAEAEFQTGSDILRVSRRDTEPPRWEGGPRPNLGPDHLADRYRLGVLDLLRPESDHDPLAREIRRHMAGGFDLGTLRGELFPSRTGQAENRNLKNALAEVTRLRTEQQSLGLEQEHLAELVTERDLAAEATRRKAALETLRALIRNREVREAADARLADLPAACARVRPEDPGRLEKLRNQDRDLQAKIRERTVTSEAAGKQLEGLRVNSGLAPGFPLEPLRRKLEGMAELAREVKHAENEAGGPHLEGVLADAAEKPRILPAILLLVAGATLLAVGLAGPGIGTGLQGVLLILGGGTAAAGILSLVTWSRGAGRARLALEKLQDNARRKDHLQKCRERLERALAEFNAELEANRAVPITDLAQAAQRLQEVADLREQVKSLESEHRTAREFLDRDRADLDRVGGEIKEILDRLDLDDGPAAAAEVSRLLDLSPRFRETVQERDDAAREIDRLEKDLAASAALLRVGESPDMSADGLSRLIDQEDRRAAELGPLEKEIARIEAEVGHAQRGHDLQEALAASEAAFEALAEVRRANRESALGRLLLDGVERQHEKESRPVVLEKAADFFRLFTGGRYELQLAAQGEGGDRFQARTEDSSAPLELSQLSDGTRAQLLLAVKLAFVTVAEEGARPPIFLDDSLTSADPERFAAVAASLGHLAAGEGRQIFYLTPDPGDAAAFGRALAAENLAAAHHIDLARVRGVAGAADPALLDPANLPARLMAPPTEGLGPAEYAEALMVPRPDPWARWQALHVFFVAGDRLDLVRRLVDGNAATVGRFADQRDTLVAAGLISAAEAAWVAAGSKLWRAWLDGWRIGRARPVTREFLRNSAAVSDNFIEAVAEVLEECRWDGGLLLDAIEARKVKGFRANKREQLRQELEEADLLSHGAPLSDDDLHAQILERVAPEIAANLLDMTKVRTMALTFARLADHSEKKATRPSS